MTTTIQIYGRLYKEPEQRTTTTGKPMVTSALVVDLGRDAEAHEWFSLVAFGHIGEVLGRHDKGDMVSVSGRLAKSSWTAKDGTVHTGFSVRVDGIASARTVGSRKAKAERERAEAAPFDDEITF